MTKPNEELIRNALGKDGPTINGDAIESFVERSPSAAAYGGGTNSAAMIIDLVNRGNAPDLVIFSDTGGELPRVYRAVREFSNWLVSKGLSPVLVTKKGGREETLEEYCHRTGFLPSLAYGMKGCSHKFKIEPQNRECNRFPLFKTHWARGGKVVKYIGYSAEEKKRVSKAKRFDDKYIYEYPLYDRGIDRAGCEEIIKNECLDLPGKSACFFCPAAKKHEIIYLRDNHPGLYQRAIDLEDMAAKAGRHDTKKIRGLGRKFSWRDVSVIAHEVVEPCLACVDYTDDDQLELFGD